MKNVSRKLRQCGVAFFLLGLAMCHVLIDDKAFAEEIVIIGNASISDSTLTSDDLKNIYLNKKAKWSNGKKIIFVTLKESDAHQEFLKQYIQRTSSQFRNFWKQQVFTGKGKMPPVLDSEEELLDFVSKTDGAVGYVSTRKATDRVKTIQVQ